MPVYVYRCEQCGQTIERRPSFSDAPLTVCESCQGSLRRVLHPVGIVFKGSGFHNTDYRTGSNGRARSDTSESKDGKAEGSPTASKDAGASAPASPKEAVA